MTHLLLLSKVTVIYPLLVCSLNAVEAHFPCLMKSQVTLMKQVLYMPELQEKKQDIK